MATTTKTQPSATVSKTRLQPLDDHVLMLPDDPETATASVIADTVKVTLGPKGRNVALAAQWGAPTITNGSVTSAKEIDLVDPYANMGAQLITQVAIGTNNVAADGTTTATVLAQAMITEGFRNVAAGANPVALKRGIEAAVQVAVAEMGDPDHVAARVDQLKTQIDVTDSDFDRETLQERRAKLAGGIAVLNVGAVTDVELTDIKMRIRDAVSATRAAIEGSVVPGGGAALIRLRRAVDRFASTLDDPDEVTGARIVHRALAAPASQIAMSAGHDPAVIVARIERELGSTAFNAANGNFQDLSKAGIIDPAKLTRAALQNAASVAALILTTECIITDQPELVLNT